MPLNLLTEIIFSRTYLEVEIQDNNIKFYVIRIDKK